MKATHFIASGKTRKFDGPIEPLRPLQLVSFTMRGDGVFVDSQGGTITCPIRPEFVLPWPEEEKTNGADLILCNPPKNIVFFAIEKFIEEVWNYDPNRFNICPKPNFFNNQPKEL